MIPVEPILCFNSFVPLNDTAALSKLFERVDLHDTIADDGTLTYAILLDYMRCLDHTEAEESDEVFGGDDLSMALTTSLGSSRIG